VGYKQITPPEWYLLVEDVFCEESTKVLLQFVKSQLSHEKSFWSYDGMINYTEQQYENLKLPVLSFAGTVDKIVPEDAIEDILSLKNGKYNKLIKYEQGHLGIIFHQETVQKMCREINKWIKSI
jgi:poly(3-hydroxyalkanoate) synthetase